MSATAARACGLEPRHRPLLVGSATSIRWCGTAARSAAVGLAVPMSRPRYTCIESIDTISTSPSACAAASASADFPDAVGPTSARCGPSRQVAAGDGDADAGGRGAVRADQLTAQPVRRRDVIRRPSAVTADRGSLRRRERSARACSGGCGPTTSSASFFDGPSTSTSSVRPTRASCLASACRSTTSISRRMRSCDDLGRDEVVDHLGRGRARTRREHERVRGVVRRGVDHLERALEVGVGLAREADDEVGGDREVGDRGTGRRQPARGSARRCSRGACAPACGRSPTAAAGAGARTPTRTRPSPRWSRAGGPSGAAT